MASSLLSSQPLPLTLPSLPTFLYYNQIHTHSLFTNRTQFTNLTTAYRRTSTVLSFVPFVGNEDTDFLVSSTQHLDDDDEDEEPTAEDLEYVAQIKRVIACLKNIYFFIFFIFHFLMPFACRFWSFLGKTGTCSLGR